MVLTMVPSLAFANEAPKRYLALGDSISNGYGLADGSTPSFVYLFANDNNLAADDQYARDGLTSAELLSTLSDDALVAAVGEADIITITIGSNDMLAALYNFIADTYNAEKPGNELTGADVQTILMGSDLEAKQALLDFAAGTIGAFAASDEANIALTGLATNLVQIATTIRECNPNVKIIVSNLYNPYGYLARIIAGTDYEGPIKAISDAFALSADAANQEIASHAASGMYFVADSYSAIAVATENPCNASLDVDTLNPLLVDLDLDFHPNGYGHRLIADEFTAALHPSYAYSDVVPGAWYVEVMDWAILNGIFGGYSGTGVMGPEDELTRAQLAEILWRIAERPDMGSTEVLDAFADVDQSAWYADSLAWAVTFGLFTGYNFGEGPLCPDEPINREQMMTVLARFAAMEGMDPSADGNLSAFADGDDVCDWAAEAVSWGVRIGALEGVEGENGALYLEPHRACLRAEMAKVLMGMMTIA